jgi:hypothetical protein
MKLGMITLLAVLLLSGPVLSAQCDTTGTRLDLRCEPAALRSGGSATLVVENNGQISPLAVSLTSVLINDVPCQIIGLTKSSATFLVPSGLAEGAAEVFLCVADGPWGRATADVQDTVVLLDSLQDPFDPDPATQNGPRIDLSREPRIVTREGSVSNPPGGHGKPVNIPCDSMHRIDGRFTKHGVDRPSEWQGITPLVGRFSTLYLDYCPITKTMYLMNDWGIGNGPYEPTCYNRFGFSTGKGHENWVVLVNHDTTKPVTVLLNGVEVTNDTSKVAGGRFGFEASLTDTMPHTLYEFGVRASSGLFFFEEGHDPVQLKPSTTVAQDCTEEGYGVIQEPYYRLATFSDAGSEVRQDQRYIPIGGIVGLEVEEKAYSGELGSDTCLIRYGEESGRTNTCTGSAVIDGDFTGTEWDGVTPARGRYSNLYARYCGGRLHILNDWVYATEQPANATCYNLFELFTGNGAEHWGIYVYQDTARGVRVFRNGEDVSDSSLIVHGGASGWGGSPLMSEPHTRYEFEISTTEGAWVLFLADPGPSSFCTNDPMDVGEEHVSDDNVIVMPNPGSHGQSIMVKGLHLDDRITVYSSLGERIGTPAIAVASEQPIDVASLVPGMYLVRIERQGTWITRLLIIGGK